MASAEEKAKKKKERQNRVRKASLVFTAATIAFIQAASTIYLREIYNVKSLLPSWGLRAGDYVINQGDFAILSRNVAVKILVDNNLLVIEQTRQVAMILLTIAVIYLAGKDARERSSLLLFIGGLAGVLYHAFLYSLLHWPDSLMTKDVVFLVPNPIVTPIYIPFLLSALAFAAGTFLLFKKK